MSNKANLSDFPSAPFLRRIAALVYDSFIVFSFLLLATTIALAVNHGQSLMPYRWLFISYLFISTGLFLSWFWITSGQTLGMLAWKIKVINQDGKTLTWKQAFLRYCVGFFSLGLGAIGLLWCLFNQDKQSLHDILLKTRVIKYQK
ncbi:MAG: RDD family protein [Proteobacteria bacterium]|nr:RDD family protein [Pseudomonadota bacterium]